MDASSVQEKVSVENLKRMIFDKRGKDGWMKNYGETIIEPIVNSMVKA